MQFTENKTIIPLKIKLSFGFFIALLCVLAIYWGLEENIKWNKMQEKYQQERMRLEKNQAHYEKIDDEITGVSISHFFVKERESAFVQDSINVLYIGNSITTAKGMPEMVADMTRARGFQIKYTVIARSGAGLREHATDQQVRNIINNQRWDYVILQEQTQRPAFSFQQVQQEVFVHARTLSEIIKSSNASTQIIFYLTMARKSGDPGNIHVSKELGTYTGMQKRINHSYKIMAQENKGYIAPVGLVWEKIRRERPEVELYIGEYHPNLTGSYIAACVFYSIFFAESPEGLAFPSEIKSTTAKYIQRITQEIIFKKNINSEFK